MLAQTGAIEGAVTCAAVGAGCPAIGAAIAGATVNAYGLGPGLFFGSAVTGAGGTYLIAGLAADDYHVQVFAAGFGTRWYDAQPTNSAATAVAVVPPATTSGIDFALQPGAGRITGTVTQAVGGDPITGAPVCVHLAAGGFVTCTSSDGTGAYDTGPFLAPGDYKVNADADPYALMWYDGSVTFTNATVVTVTDGGNASGRNFALVAGRSIDGQVTCTDPGLAPCPADGEVGGASVDFIDPATGDWVRTVTADADGIYTSGFRLFPQAWKVQARATGFVDTFYTSPIGGTFDRAQATPVDLTAADAAGIDIPMPRSGSMSGTVTGPGGAPLAGATVQADPAIVGTFRSAVTAADGSYTITGLREDDYRVHAIKDGLVTEWYDGQLSNATAALVGVSPGAGTGGISFDLAGGAGGISGVVTDADGNPIPFAGVGLHLDGVGFVVFVTADENGVYDTGLILAPGSYRLDANAVADGFGQLWSGNSLTFDGATVIDVAAGSTTTAAQSPAVDFALPRAGTISGTATCAAAHPPFCAAAGAPLAGVVIEIYDAATNGFVTGSFGPMITDAAGQYTTTQRLPANVSGFAGTYKVRARLTGFLTRFSGNAATFAAAQVVTVTPDTTVTVNIELPPARTISGTITSTLGGPLAGATVDILDATTGALVVGGTGTLVTGASGTYTSGAVLAPGTYKVRARLAGFLDRFYPSALDLASATAVDVTAGDAAGIDVALPPKPPFISLRDEFEAAQLDQTLWADREFARRIVDVGGNKVLESAIRRFGSNGSNSLRLLDEGIGNPLTDSHSTQVDVTVTALDIVNARPRARILVYLFNDNRFPGGENAGAVQAEIAIRHTGTQLQVTLDVTRCEDAPCVAFTNFFFDTTTFDPGALGSTHTMSIAWDAPTRTVIFGFDGGTRSFDLTTVDVQIDGPPTQPLRFIGTRVSSITSATGGGAITVRFDNVVVNGTLYDDFEDPSGLIDRTKWQDLEFVREINPGSFVSSLRRFDLNGSNTMTLVEPNPVTALEADVTVTAFDAVNASSAARLIINAYSCLGPGSPCGEGPGVDRAGDVTAGIDIRHVLGELRGVFFVVRCLVDACNVAGEVQALVFDTTSFGTVALGSTHRLGLAWTGSQFVFRFDGTSVTFDPTPFAPVHGPATEPFKGIGTRVTAIDAAGEGGSITTRFDNFVGGYFASGRITAGDGVTPLAGATVTAYQGGVAIGAPAESGANGTYTIPDLPAGTYQFGATAEGLVERFFNGQPALGSATPVTIAEGGAALGVNVALIAVGAGTTAKALGSPLLLVPEAGTSAAHPMGAIEIDEQGSGVLAPGTQITLTLPPGVRFAAPPVPSTIVGNGLTVGAGALDGLAQSFTFGVLSSSSGNPARLLVSGLSVTVDAGLVGRDLTAPVTTSVTGTGNVTPADVQNATAVGPSTLPTIDAGFAAVAGQGAAGTVIEVTGANFSDGAAVCVGSGAQTIVTDAEGNLQCTTADLGIVATVVAGSPTALTVAVTVPAGVPPSGDPGGAFLDVTVVNPGDQTAVLAEALEVTAAPQVTATDRQAASPLFQNVPGQQVVITGTGFLPPTTSPPDIGIVFSGTGITVDAVEYVSETQLLVTVSVADTAPFGLQTVTVVNPDGGTAPPGPGATITIGAPPGDAAIGLPAPKTKPDGSSPPPASPPVISSLNPAAARRGSSIAINGSGFSATASSNSVTFAGAGGVRLAATVTAASTAQLTVTVPADAIDGAVTVAVGGQLSAGVTFSVTDPTLSTVSPASATQGTTPNVALTGAKLVAGAVVTFAPPDGLAPGAAVVSGDGASLTVPVTVDLAAPTGLRSVTVTNPDGGTATRTSGFEVLAPVAGRLVLSVVGAGIATETYLPTVGAVSVTLGADGRCTARVVTPGSVALRVQFVSDVLPAPAPPANVTLALTSSALPGTAINEDCEPVLPATADWSVGTASPTSQQVVVAGAGTYDTTLYSHDWGGTVTVQATATLADGVTVVTGTLILPVDADGDGVPDTFETANGLNPFLAGDAKTRDGLTNLEKYRGVYLVGPAPGTTGTMSGHQRLSPLLRHLFVRGRGFGNDPSLPAGTCGINPVTGVAVADGNVSATDPCPPFEVGPAFAAVGVQVVDATASFTSTTQLPTKSYANGTSATLDLATVVYDGASCSGAEACDQTSKVGIRNFQNPTLGFSTFGGVNVYGAATVYKRSVEAYFRHRPYQHRTNDPARVVLGADGRPMLAPITLVGDANDNGIADRKEATVGGELAGDTYVAGSAVQTLSAQDVNNDGCVELPFVPDPTTIAGKCDPAAATGTGHASQATRRQVVRSLITHELGHAVGVNIHTTDPLDLMYQYTINWLRDGFFSPTAADLIQIHNKGLQ